MRPCVICLNIDDSCDHQTDPLTNQQTNTNLPIAGRDTKMAPTIKTKKVEVEKDEESGVMRTEVRSLSHLIYLTYSII